MAEIVVGFAELLQAATCLASDEVGHFVYIAGPRVADTLQVARADITTIAKMPAVGVITAKQSATACTVLLLGEYAPGVALTPNQRVWVGANGYAALTRPAAPAFLQVVGQALDEARVLVSPSRDLCKVIA